MSAVDLKLMIMSGPDDGLVHHLEGDYIYDERLDQRRCRFTLGRRESCDVCIPFDTLVSRLHASLQVSPEGDLWLVDEESRNGTYLDRDQVSVPVTLDVHQMFRIGNTWIRVQSLALDNEE